MTDSSGHALGPDGEFAQVIPNFVPRREQQEMALAIEQAIRNRHVLVTEAGTGTGKTFAYLVPALQNGGKVIVSTGTKTLQDQLFYRDLPQVIKALGSSASIALLKGRANYLCHYRFQQAEAANFDTLLQAQLELTRSWFSQTDSGDISQCSDVPEDSRMWPLVTSTVDNCLAADCPCYQSCFVLKARRTAQEADLVVINHHLFFIDLSLKGEGFADILPSADAVIFDEAHQVVDVARQFFGESLSSRRITELVRDVERESQVLQDRYAALPEPAESLLQAVNQFRISLGVAGQRSAWDEKANQWQVHEALDDLGQQLEAYAEALESQRDRSTGMERCFQRAMDISARLSNFLENERRHTTLADLNGDDSESNLNQWIAWYETFERRFVLHNTPVDIGAIFLSHVELSHCAWIFTSATLSVGGGFDHFVRELGLQQAEIACWDSPFKFEENALLYTPDQLPDVSSSNYHRALVAAALPLIEAVGGKTFFLLTSYDALHKVKAVLQQETAFELLVQGELPKATLLERFRQQNKSILLGTASFWEGVDVKGPALSCVIIDKLPFASPGDPVLQAQLRRMDEQGINAFMNLQLPQAVIRLKQGVGRLIRDEKDTGILLIGDNRLYKKSYGRLFLKSLPALPVVRDWPTARQFIEEKLCG